MRKALLRLTWVAGIVLLAVPAAAGTGTLVILHTNDMHDCIRPGEHGRGGLPYVSGYIHQVRAQRNDVIVLDAGDVMEKGDMLPFHTKGAAMFQAMNMAGYDACALGNHDYAYGWDNLLECKASADFPLLSANIPEDREGYGKFPKSVILDVDGVRIGVIGASRNFGSRAERGRLKLPEEQSEREKLIGTQWPADELAALLEAEAQSLRANTHFIIALIHEGISRCKEMAPGAPAIDLWISGHTNERTPQPLVVKETGARIVQAGSSAEYVGRMELTLDLDTRQVEECRYKLVPMDQHVIPRDEKMMRWIEQREAEVCPDAMEVLGTAPAPIKGPALAKLIASAMLAKTGAAVALCHTDKLGHEPDAGELTRNAAFRAYVGGEDRREVICTALTGREILDCIDLGQFKPGKEEQCWAGFRARLGYWRPAGKRVIGSDLDAARLYLVAMTWEEYRLGILGERPFTFKDRGATHMGYSCTDVLADHLAALSAGGTPWPAPSPRPLPRAHAHNDYEHARPLLDALDNGFCSVETDVHLVDGQLLVAHDRQNTQPKRTLQALYLDPLRARIRANGGGVYPNGPEFYLMIDFKSAAEPSYAVLRSILADYEDILTTYADGKKRQGAVTVVITGDRPTEAVLAESTRRCALDGRFADMPANASADLYPLVSANWRDLFTWDGNGIMPQDELENLRAFFARAHAGGHKARFYGLPWGDAIWKTLYDEGADLINADRLEALKTFLLRQD